MWVVWNILACDCPEAVSVRVSVCHDAFGIDLIICGHSCFVDGINDVTADSDFRCPVDYLVECVFHSGSPFLEAAADVVAEAEDGFEQGILILAVLEADAFGIESGLDEDTLAEVVIFFHVDVEGDVFVVLDDYLEAGLGLAGVDVFLGEVSAFIGKLGGEQVFQFVGSHGVFSFRGGGCPDTAHYKARLRECQEEI